MNDTYLDREGRECARLRNTADATVRVWRGWFIWSTERGTRWGLWHARHHGEYFTTMTFSEMRRKLVEEDKQP